MRDVKADMYSTASRSFGELPGPAELARVQMRCRPRPGDGRGRTVSFDAATRRRLAGEFAPLPEKGTRRGVETFPLGITGAQVADRTDRKALFVVHVIPDTPADGILRKGDVIIGANVRFFVDAEDPRPEMGSALAESQSPRLGGTLTLQIARSGEPRNVQIDLADTQSYSKTWPFDWTLGKSKLGSALSASAYRALEKFDCESSMTSPKSVARSV